MTDTPNHVLHLLLSVVTMGIWLIVWFIIAMSADRQARCPWCGYGTEYRRNLIPK